MIHCDFHPAGFKGPLLGTHSGGEHSSGEVDHPFIFSSRIFFFSFNIPQCHSTALKIATAPWQLTERMQKVVNMLIGFHKLLLQLNVI